MALAVVVSLLIAFTGSAQALEFEEVGSFGGVEGPVGMAIDQTSGDVYVADLNGQHIARFDASGNPLSPAVMGEGFFSGIGVDPVDGDVYGDNLATGELEVFDSSGNLVTSFPDPGAALAQFGTDPAGNIFYPHEFAGEVLKLSPGGETIGGPYTCGECPGFAFPFDVSVDGEGSMYVGGFNEGFSGRGMSKLDAAGDRQPWPPIEGFLSLGVDASRGRVYVGVDEGMGSYGVKVFDTGGDELGSLPPGLIRHQSHTQGIAINEATGHIYVADAGNHKVWIFAPFPKASVAAETPSPVTAYAAVLRGSVNPNRSRVSDCQFEYTTAARFESAGFEAAQQLPCSPDPGAGSKPIAVHATAVNLDPDTAYDYRIVATNGGGTIASGGIQSFTTSEPPPTAITGAASAIGQTAATISGSVNPHGSATSCRFEYGTTTAYGNILPCPRDPGAGEAPVAEAVELGGLAPATTYHYRLAAFSSAGGADGSDATFTTSPATCPAEASLCPPPVARTQGGGAVRHSTTAAAYRSCVRKARLAYRQTKKAARRKPRPAASKVMKMARRKMHKALRKCSARFL